MTYKKFAVAVAENIQNFMLLQEWKVELKLDAQMSEPHHIAECLPNWKYLEAVIALSPRMEEAYKKGEYRYVAEIMAHEYAHLITAPLAEIAAQGTAPAAQTHLSSTEEQLTQRIANIVVKGLPRGAYAP